ncbi:Orn/Lys/Arg decarboxylase N-terminal domain-containing protein, partial [Eikenella corrodens]|nr:Orn/Lys/Arg decarboxylase N-terminal domain-containing protein [Eikenella corrodens]
MTFLKVAASPSVQQGFTTQLDVVDVQGADLAGIGAVVASTADAAKAVEQVEATGFGIPVFVALQPGESVPESLLTRVNGVIQLGRGNEEYYGRQVDT